MRILLLLMFTALSYSENAPIGYIKDSSPLSPAGSPVYEFYDTTSGKRFLVFKFGSNNGVVMEANGKIQEPEKVIIPVVKTNPELEYWERARSYSFTKPMMDTGWELEGKTTVEGNTVYLLRRPNPNFKGVPYHGPVEK